MGKGKPKRPAAPTPPSADDVAASGWSYSEAPSAPPRARTPIMAVFLGSLWLLLNNGGGSDLAKAPPFWFALLWWTWVGTIAWQLMRRPEGLWHSLDRSLKLPFLGLTAAVLINVSAAAEYSVGGQLAHIAWPGWVWWLSLLLSGVLLVHWLHDDLPGLAPVVLQCVLVIGVVIAVHGLLEYVQSEQQQPLGGIFAWHNPAGGYFALLLPIALARALGDRRTASAAGYAAIALLLGVALLATNSRGSWLCATVGMGYLAIRLLAARSAVPWRLGALVGAMVLAIALPFLIGGPLAPIRDRLVSLTATADFSMLGRTEFYGTAWRLFAKGPTTDPQKQGIAVFGTGMWTYKYHSPKQQLDPRYYASDPHSILFQWLAELGVLGIGAYLLAWSWWAWLQWGSPLFRAIPVGNTELEMPPWVWEGAPLDLHGICAGLLAGWLHWSIDFDATYMLIAWTAVILMAVLIASLRAAVGAGPLVLSALPPAPKPASGSPLREYQAGRLLGGLLALALMLGWLSALRYAAAKYFYDRAELSFAAWEQHRTLDMLPLAQKDYALAAAIYPLDGEGWRGFSISELWLAEQAMKVDREAGILTLRKAHDHAREAIKYAAYDARNWNNLAQINGARLRHGEIDQGEAVDQLQSPLISAIWCDPINNPQYYIQLTQALALSPASRERDQAIALNMDALIVRYPPESITEFSKTRLDWQLLPLGYAQVWPYYLLSLRGLDNAEGLRVARETALTAIIPSLRDSEYIPVEVRAKLIPILQEFVDQIDDPTGEVILTPELLQALHGFGVPSPAQTPAGPADVEQDTTP